MKILFFVGKGGVGKSTNSALFAVKIARSGKKVLLNSIDPAHNLRDIFQVSLNPKPKELLPNLAVMETELDQWVKKYLKSTEDDFKAVYKYQEAFNLHKYFRTLKYSPGLEEYAVLLAMVDTVQSNREMDYIIFDTPPTALTLKFMALPSVSLLWLNELIKFRQTILDKKKIITRIKNGRRKAVVETDPILAKIECMVTRYREFDSLLKDRQLTRLFAVVNPDKLSQAETELIYKELKNFGIAVSFLILNRYRGEEHILSGLEKKYNDSMVIKLARQDKEVIGIEMLEAIDLPVEIGEI